MEGRDPPAPPSSQEVAGEDFLFHLYRGSELLQDNRVHDAKAELEQALRFQPSDPKGQDLLGIVYFRLGLYPRSIAIYEKLVQSHPEAIEPRVNLALSYLKTGQAAAARAELERVVAQNPHHSRAWGYLGLSFQRLGNYERASHAFAAGGHDVMARRLLDMAMLTSTSAPMNTGVSLAPGPGGGRLDSRRPPPSLGSQGSLDGGAEPEASESVSAAKIGVLRVPSGAWTTIDAVNEGSPNPGPISISDAMPAPAPASELNPRSVIAPAPPTARPSSLATLLPGPKDTLRPPDSEVDLRPRVAAPTPVAQALRDALVVFPRALPIALHPSGVVLVQATDGFAVRLDAVRSMALTAPSGPPLRRHVRGRMTDEPLGGAASPIVDLPGKSELLLAAGTGHKLLPLSLGDEPLYLREDALAGFEPSVTYENGRLPVGDGDAIAMVQLRGPGTIIASLPEKYHAVEVTEGRHLTVRAADVVAWSGRLLPRALLASEAPAGSRGLAAFTGDGMVLLDGRG